MLCEEINLRHARITKEFRFEMAHALPFHDGPCRNIHGHSYRLLVSVTGPINRKPEHPKSGMIIDFSELKAIVNDKILSVFDHALVLCKHFPDELKTALNSQKLVFTDFQPTCENLVVEFAERIRYSLPEGVILKKLQLHETATAYAEWYAEDNIRTI